MSNGVLHYVLSFTSGQWLRLVPTSCDVFPNAVSTAVQYLSLTFPVDESWTRYNSLHQLAYFITVFVAVPTSVVTELMQSPTISNRLGWFGRALNRQKARTLHFIALWWFLLFIMAHVTLVFITDPRVNRNMMWAEVHDYPWRGFAIFVPAIMPMAIAWWRASPFNLRHARLVQRIGEVMSRQFGAATQSWDAKRQLAEEDISSQLWPSGTMPRQAKSNALVAADFAGYRVPI